jgi:hypothetical protein
MQRIVFPNPAGGISIILPVQNSGIALHEIARKDVPSGVPFRILQASDIPSDRTYRDAWTLDFSDPDGYGIGDAAWRLEQMAQGAV